MQNPRPITLIALSASRFATEVLTPFFHGTRFTCSAILDLSTLSPANLALVLRVLKSRPRCLIVGEAMSEEIKEQAKEVWEEYVGECRVDGGGGVVRQLSIEGKKRVVEERDGEEDEVSIGPGEFLEVMERYFGGS